MAIDRVQFENFTTPPETLLRGNAEAAENYVKAEKTENFSYTKIIVIHIDNKSLVDEDQIPNCLRST